MPLIVRKHFGAKFRCALLIDQTGFDMLSAPSVISSLSAYNPASFAALID
jgi:hypothetical protein